MKKKILEREVRLTGRKARRVDLHAWIRKERKRSQAFREVFDEARQATEIARELARIRRDEGVSQAEIARRLKTSQQAISRMEQPDYAGYSLRTLVRYAESLGRELRFFVSEPEEPYGSRRKSKR
jgi:DNA-binding XRE family transcriptional regulator